LKKALLVCGGWEGHQPEAICEIFARALAGRGFSCETVRGLDLLADSARLGTFDVVFPCWTMGELDAAQEAGLVGAVRSGVGLAGIHGGMGDAFRGKLEYEWMVGGHFVGHPHVGAYTVRTADPNHPITKDLPTEFDYHSEQYYMLMDPGVHVLAETDYSHEGRMIRMPVAWTKEFGKGRVFYSSLGHDPTEMTDFPVAFELALRGVEWAARS
jgi:hypothetical protein